MPGVTLYTFYSRLLLPSRQHAADASVVNWRLVKLCDVDTLPRTGESTQVPQWLLGSLASSAPLDRGRAGSVAPQLLLHAVVDGRDVGCRRRRVKAKTVKEGSKKIATKPSKVWPS